MKKGSSIIITGIRTKTLAFLVLKPTITMKIPCSWRKFCKSISSKPADFGTGE